MKLKKGVIHGLMEDIRPIIKADLDSGRHPQEILKELIEGMEVVGDLFEKKEYYVPETLLSAHTMKLGIEVLKPYLSYEKSKVAGRALVGAVESDIHDIGLNLVAMFLEAAGFEIYNLGRDVPKERFLEKIIEVKPHILGVSAMMSTTALKVKELIQDFESRGLRAELFIVVGGTALSEEFAKEIGADGYASDAKKAVQVFEKLLERSQ